MARPNRISVHLEVDLASQPIEGEVSALGRPAHAFVGWLGLTSALEHAVADGQRATADSRDTGTPA